MSPRTLVIAATLAFAAGLALGRVTSIWLSMSAASAVTLVMWLVAGRPGKARLTRGGPAAAILGAIEGLGLALVTWLVMRGVAPRVPGVAAELQGLFAWLWTGPSAPVAGALLVVFVVTEELVWRGALVPYLESRYPRWGVVFGGAAIYAIPQVASGSWILPLAAFGLGVVWTWQRVRSGGLVLPLACHLVWDLLIVFVLPPPV